MRAYLPVEDHPGRLELLGHRDAVVGGQRPDQVGQRGRGRVAVDVFRAHDEQVRRRGFEVGDL